MLDEKKEVENVSRKFIHIVNNINRRNRKGINGIK